MRDEPGAVEAVSRLASLDRARVRAGFERRFTSRRMAEPYAALYADLAKRENGGAPETAAAAQ